MRPRFDRNLFNPFFNALGWDIYNRQGYAEAYKDVIHEDAIKVGSAVKAPDYCFRIGGTRKFFLEAKKPSVNIKEDISPAYQLRRYAWSAKLPLSILTDFEELAVYDCRIKPVKTDKPSTARTLYLFTMNMLTAGMKSPPSSHVKLSLKVLLINMSNPAGQSVAQPEWMPPSSKRLSAGGKHWPETSPCGTPA
jgi:Uncharacterized conserved protein